MKNNETSSQRLAVLIDGDNIKAQFIEPLLKEVSRYGTAYVRRVYGDWTNNQLSGWKKVLNQFSIQPIQQFAFTAGKNATDSALIIDAMDLLYTSSFDGFCIVSSDSDFTRLASRIRESGLKAYGFGEKKTPEPFVNACDKFIHLENLIAESSDTTAVKTSTKTNKKLIQLLKDAHGAISGDDGWAELGPLGSQLNKLSPSFDPRNHGYKKLGELIANVNIFEIKRTPHQNNPTVFDIHIRLKNS
ncbi:MAG: NYN domain-containing protein [Leptolyngbya sp. RL_3_1]|nr:NYN domain-containing protein [Leptolyngbya sp. RL_3_1]